VLSVVDYERDILLIQRTVRAIRGGQLLALVLLQVTKDSLVVREHHQITDS
jgi:hypothetical protein